MKDSDELEGYGVPDWAEEIIERHDLGLRADAPLSAAIVLLTDAAADLDEVSKTAFKEQALSARTFSRLDEIVSMVEDARKLSALCANEPVAGIVTVSGGTLTWKPIGLGDH